MKVALIESFESPPSRYLDVEPSVFLDIMADPGESPSIECPAEADKLAGRGFATVEYVPNAPARKNQYLSKQSTTQVLAFDVDHMTSEAIDAAWATWQQYDVALYSTWQHTDANPRFRLLLALDKPIPNTNKVVYKAYYKAAADALGIEFDKQAADRSRFYFEPQHKPGCETERHRFKGVPFPISKVDVSSVKTSGTPGGSDDDFEVTKDRPTRQEVTKLAKNLRESFRPTGLKLATAFEAILRGEPFAPTGSRHGTTLRVTTELIRAWPQLDSKWFADEYLVPSVWPQMWPEDIDSAFTDWDNAVEGAKVLKSERDAKARAAAEAVAPRERAEFSTEERQLAVAHAGHLAVSHHGNFYIYDPREDEFKGPFKTGEVPVALRDLLGGIDGVTEKRYRKNGFTLKTATDIVHEYGTTADDVIWYAKKPPEPWNEKTRTVYRQAYKWMEWPAIRHKIAEELLIAMTGGNDEKLEELLAYLSRFRDLSIPLPALTLVGNRGIWKSRVCELLGLFWTDPVVSHSNSAIKALGRFNDCLLYSPIIWSDERLALSSFGKPQPELYRESITSRVQHVEAKGVATTRLFSCVRHLVTANDEARVFSDEVDSASVEATMERFIVLNVDAHAVAKFEEKWAGTEELDRLRKGGTLLEYIRWIEETTSFTSKGRLFVAPKTDRGVMLRSRFNNDTLNYIWQLVFDSLEREAEYSVPGNLNRCPLSVDEEYRLRISPLRIHELWADSKAVAGCGLKKPTPQKIGTILSKSGFKVNKHERVAKRSDRAWEVNTRTLQLFMEVSDSHSWSEIQDLCQKIFGRSPAS